MKITPGLNVLLTGASGGLGVVIARALAELRTNLALVAYPGVGLDALVHEVSAQGIKARAWASDLRDASQRRRVVREVCDHFGGVHLLINNAGVEYNSYYHELTEERIGEVIDVNLTAAMIMARLVLPIMVDQGSGHIVSVSSLAGKAGPAFQEPYAATKAGLIAFTASLRASYRNSGVSASVIVPGFVEAGIYTRLKDRCGMGAPGVLTGSTPAQVADAIVQAVNRDIPELIVNRFPIRPLAAVYALSPRLGDWIVTQFGVHDFFRRVVEVEKEKSRSGSPNASSLETVGSARR